MKTSLSEILEKALIGKKIKLYKVLDKQHNKDGNEYCLTDFDEKTTSKKCVIIGETHGYIKTIETSTDTYDGDFYDVLIVDDNGQPIHFNGLGSITSKLEIINE